MHSSKVVGTNGAHSYTRTVHSLPDDGTLSPTWSGPWATPGPAPTVRGDNTDHAGPDASAIVGLRPATPDAGISRGPGGAVHPCCVIA